MEHPAQCHRAERYVIADDQRAYDEHFKLEPYAIMCSSLMG